MRETIQNYFEKTKQYPNYYSNEDFSTICDGIKKEIDKGVFLVKRKDETDLFVFEENLVLFVMVLKRKLIRVYFLLRGKMKQICLYLKKNMDIDGEVEDKPIANSLKELINNMNVNPNIRKKEENKCCL